MSTAKNIASLILKLTFLSGIFILPFIYWPPAPVVYEVPRVWFYCRWMEILVLVCLLCLLINPGIPSEHQPDRSLIWLVILFLFSTITASIMGVDFIKSLLGNYYRADGLLTLFHLAALFFFLVLFWVKKWKYPTIIVLASGSAILSLWAIISAFLSHYSTAIGITFGQPVFLAGYLVVTLPLTFYLVESIKIKPFRIIWGIFFLIQILAIIATRAWGGIAGIIFFFPKPMLSPLPKKLCFGWLPELPPPVLNVKIIHAV